MKLIGYLKYSSQLLIFTNLLVAFAATAQMALTYFLLEIPVKYALLVVEFTSTLLFYNFSLYLSLPKTVVKTPFARTNWILNHKKFFYGFSFICALALIYFGLQLDFFTQIFLVIIGLISALYAFPIFKYHNKWVNLRSIPYAKVFFISFIWLMSTFWLPILDSQLSGELSATHNLPIRSIHRYLFLFLCTLPFDLRDAKADKYYGIKTFSTQLGIKNSIRLINGLILLHAALGFYLDVSIEILIALWVMDLIVIIFFNLWIVKRNDYLLYYLMDFFLVLQFILVLFFQYI